MITPKLPEIYTLFRDGMNDAQKQKVLCYALQDTLGKDYFEERGISLSESPTGERLNELISVYGLEYQKQSMAEQEETRKASRMNQKAARRYDIFSKVSVMIGAGCLIIATFNIGYNMRKETKPTTTCYHHTLGTEETLDNVITYLKTKDPTVSKDKVIAQNHLNPGERFKAGQDITYCFDEK